GQLVYATTNLNQGWDGSINGKIQTTGTYVWMVEGVTKEDKIIRKKGTVVLIK
nr:gliding motility-associated C-terminal domain-containing protein [Flavisolibacter sp.]